MPAIIENGVLVKYNYCPEETEYTIPEGVHTIGSHAFETPFRSPLGLKKLNIPNSVTTLADFAFSGVHNAPISLIIPDSVTTLGRGCFTGSGFHYVHLSANIKVLPDFCFDGDMLMTTLDLPEGLEELGISSLGAVRGMRTLHLPDSIKVFHRRAMTGSDLFDSGRVNFPKNVQFIEPLAFDGASGIAEVSLPEGTKKVWEGAFSGCPSIETAVLPEGLEEIDDRAFAYCKSLTEINIPSTVKRIGERAFSGCSSLKKITLPEGLTEIAPKAFYACVNLEEINLPAAASVGKDAFYNCPKLK